MPITLVASGALALASFQSLTTTAADHTQMRPMSAPFAGVLYADIPYYPGATKCTPSTSGPCPSIPAGSTQCLDVRVPQTIVHPKPTILFVHGGGWGAGDKNSTEGNIHSVRSFLDNVASLGYRVVSCNYTLSCDDPATPTVYDAPSFPHAVRDVRAAIGWIRTHGALAPYELSECIVLVGASAGAHLAAMAGALNTDNVHYAPVGYETADLSVQLTVAYSADFDMFRRGCTTTLCPCEGCGLRPHVHAAGFVNEPGGISQQFVGQVWGVPAPGYLPWPCPSGPWDYTTFAPGSTTGDPFLNASPVHWLHPASSPFYVFQSRCDLFTPLDDHAWMTQATAQAGVSYAEDIQPCGHGLRIHGGVVSANKLNQVIQFWSGYTHCP
ncbi:MAG: alpha/beta hydrolase fold domain-containing protein [Planctomycetota bacterium]